MPQPKPEGRFSLAQCECGCGRPRKPNRRGKPPRWFSDACRKRAARADVVRRRRWSRGMVELGAMTVAERRLEFLKAVPKGLLTVRAKVEAIANGVPLPMGRAVARAVRKAMEGR